MIAQTKFAQSTKLDKTMKVVKGKTNLANSVRQIEKIAVQISLGWSHIQRIMRVTNPEARAWYLKESC